MIVEYVRYQLINKPADALLSAYRAAGPSLAAAPECLGYEVTQCVDEPASVVVRILWTSAQDHMTRFRSGPHFPPFLTHVRPFVGDIAEMRHYEVTDIVWSR